MARRERVGSLLGLLGLLLSPGWAQRPADGRGAGSPSPGPLHETIQAVFDTDKDGALSLDEIQSTLDGLAAVAAMGMAGGAAGAAGDSGNVASQLAARVRAAKDFAPMLVKWMDVDSDGALSQSELQWVTSAHARMKQSLKELTRDIFDAMDADADDSISPQEIEAAMAPAVLGKVCGPSTRCPQALPPPSPAKGRWQGSASAASRPYASNPTTTCSALASSPLPLFPALPSSLLLPLRHGLETARPYVTAPAPSPALPQVVSLLEAGFPVPSLSASAALTAEHVASLLSLVDSDADGSVSRKEAYTAVASFKKQFLEAATLLETMGPMLAVFGGGIDRGRGGAGRSAGRGGRGGGAGAPGSGTVKVARPTHEPPKTEL